MVEVVPAEPEISPEEPGVDEVVALDDSVEVLPPEPEEQAGGADDAAAPAVTRAKGLVPFDALSAYLSEISQYAPLSREREKELAVRYHKSRDRQAAYELVTSNLLLVVKIARDYERAARNLLDLIQEGNIGLMEAVKNFDPYRGVRFPSYAIWWIKAYIIRFILANWRMVKIGTTQAQRKLFFNLKKEREKLERDGFYPTPKLLAEKLDVRESDVVEMEQRLGGADMSIDAPIQAGSDASLASVLPAAGLSVEEAVSRKQLSDLLQQSLDEFTSTLNPKEQTIFKERVISDEKATLHQLADKLGLSPERVRQLENRVKEKLKSFLYERLGSAIENLGLEGLDL